MHNEVAAVEHEEVIADAVDDDRMFAEQEEAEDLAHEQVHAVLHFLEHETLQPNVIDVDQGTIDTIDGTLIDLGITVPRVPTGT